MRKSINIFIISFFIFILSHVNLYAQQDVFSREYPRIMTSVRAMGMGNAFFGVSDDKYAAFYNPAGLARNKSLWSLDLVPLTFGMNSDMFQNIATIVSLADDKNNVNTNNVAMALDSMIGTYNSLNPAGIFPAFTYKNWSVGLFANSNATFIPYGRAMPSAGAKFHVDIGGVVIYAHSFLPDNSLHVGASLIGLFRMGYAVNYTFADIPTIDGDQLLKNISSNQGWGIYGSVGVMYELPWLRKELNPRVGLSFNEFGFSSFGPWLEKINPTLNLSFAISPKWEYFTSNIVVDFNDLLFMAGSDQSFGKRVSIGAEVVFFERLFLRTGLHQGYWTAGIGMNIWILRINYAYYTEELGAYAGQFADKRHVLEVVLGWDQLLDDPINKL